MCVYIYGLPWWLSNEESACNTEDAGDVGSIPGSERSLGGRHGNSLQYCCLENPMDRGAWRATYKGSQRVGHDWSDLAAAVDKQLHPHSIFCEALSWGHVHKDCLCPALKPAGQLPFWQYQGVTSPFPAFCLDPLPSSTIHLQGLSDLTLTEVSATFPRCLPFDCSVSWICHVPESLAPHPSPVLWVRCSPLPALILPAQTTWVPGEDSTSQHNSSHLPWVVQWVVWLSVT